ncbi:DarT ssDNA thymidine ADP-ribosyltransferase family protein [Caproiciproducens sp.]|uniref:DarT ssDNA thymidine ADP-ribosyltransferase family protein n=1 Tax=Caproiciproducens sp. TaxID=1954376 RepID=UPI002897104B|nr:DarT ssDNA thymidine ADP-ribosyltransferase family protein [Caproiciproducens sp.]
MKEDDYVTYKEIIEYRCSHLHSSISWWPRFFYHFTDINNAMGIIDQGWIYGRNDAKKNHLMQSDNASQSVISVTSNFVKDYGRLYFRPLTPTQYHNEGYKPEHIRKSEINACCPVPIFFCLDAETILNIEGVEFVECGLAGQYHNQLQHGINEFSKLNYSKIYHTGYFDPYAEGDITQYRHSEVIRSGGIPIERALRKVFCRSPAEKQTLIYLIEKTVPLKLSNYIQRIDYNPQLALFNNNGIFIKTVETTTDGLKFNFNETSLRYGREKSKGQDLLMTIHLYWINDRLGIFDHEMASTVVDYSKQIGVRLDFGKKQSNCVLVEARFDDHLMYMNYINLTEQELL